MEMEQINGEVRRVKQGYGLERNEMVVMQECLDIKWGQSEAFRRVR